MIPANKKVNILGKYLYKHLDGAFKYTTTSNTCDVYFTLLYQLRPEDQLPSNTPEENDVHELTIDLSITTYQNKIRVNILEVTAMEKTIGCDVYDPEITKDLKSAMDLIYSRTVKRVSRAFKDYDFLF